MARQRPVVAAGFTADGPALVAILDTLNDLYDLLDERLPSAVQAPQPDGDGTVRLTEPTVPAPAGVPLTEPATGRPKRAPEPPPRHGRGSGTYFWGKFARDAGVDLPDGGAGRAEIIAACERAGVLPAAER